MMIRHSRQALEAFVEARAAKLPPDARAALVDMVGAIRGHALTCAFESLGRKKWMMHAYWRVVAVYAGHLARIVRRVR